MCSRHVKHDIIDVFVLHFFTLHFYMKSSKCFSCALKHLFNLVTVVFTTVRHKDWLYFTFQQFGGPSAWWACISLREQKHLSSNMPLRGVMLLQGLLRSAASAHTVVVLHEQIKGNQTSGLSVSDSIQLCWWQILLKLSILQLSTSACFICRTEAWAA